ncbi:MAG: hypothetical protein AAFU61_04690 [Pseudomonadota bacterium]
MKTYLQPHVASLVNAVVLIVMSGWAYLVSAAPSTTMLIPAFVGAALLACLPGVKAENKLVAHIAVGLTALIFLALFMPLSGALGRGDAVAIFRTGMMSLTTALALAVFVKSFIDARRARA